MEKSQDLVLQQEQHFRITLLHLLQALLWHLQLQQHLWYREI